MLVETAFYVVRYTRVKRPVVAFENIYEIHTLGFDKLSPLRLAQCNHGLH